MPPHQISPEPAQLSSPLGLLVLALAPALAALAMTVASHPEQATSAPDSEPAAQRARVAPDLPSPPPPATTASTELQFAALDPPLIGVARSELIATIGRPAARRTEGGAKMELLDYRVDEREYQVAVLDGRVVEINRFR